MCWKKQFQGFFYSELDVFVEFRRYGDRLFRYKCYYILYLL